MLLLPLLCSPLSHRGVATTVLYVEHDLVGND
jgi:hypothetical protein